MASYIIGFPQTMNPLCLFLRLLGTSLGIFLEASPSIASSMGIVLALPLTYSMGIINGMSPLLGIYIGSISGGLITAILIDISDTPASVTTAFDSRLTVFRGEGGRTIRVGTLYLSPGGMVNLTTPFLISPVLAKWVLKFSYEEYPSIAVLSLFLIPSPSGKSVVKGLIDAFIGIIFATMGIAPVDTVRQYTLGLTSPDDDLRLPPLMIGVYAMAEVLKVATASDQGDIKPLNYKSKGLGVTWKEFREQSGSFIVSSPLGVRIGVLPGLGVVISNLTAYFVSRKMPEHPERYGTGCTDSLIALETANNAMSGGTLIPLLTVGIPGDAGTTILLAAFMLGSITSGPLLSDMYSDVIYAMFMIPIVADIMMLLIQVYGLPVFLRLLSIPENMLFPAVTVPISIRVFAVNNRIFDIWSTLFFVIVGYELSWFEFSPAPIVLGFILDPITELNFRRGMTSSYGTLSNFFTCLIFETALALTILLLITQIVHMTRTRQKTKVNS